MDSRMIPNRSGLAALAAVLMLAACGVVDTDTTGGDAAMLARTAAAQNPSATPVGPNGAFFPLTIGDRWEYSGEFSLWMEGGSRQTQYTYESRTLTGFETLFGREYVIEEQSIVFNSMPPAAVRWYRYRQDKAGLYEADVSITDPPGDYGPQEAVLTATGTVSPRTRLFAALAAETRAEELAAFEAACGEMRRKLALLDHLRGGSDRALLGGGPPGGVLPDEITRLRYPLHVGQEWVIRDSPLFTSVVERHEVLDLPAGKFGGWRINARSALTGPEDTVLLWYGRDGLLATYVHLEVEMVGPTGDPLGTMISEERVVLEEIEIDR